MSTNLSTALIYNGGKDALCASWRRQDSGRANSAHNNCQLDAFVVVACDEFSLEQASSP